MGHLMAGGLLPHLLTLTTNEHGGCFLLPYPTVTNSFHFQKWNALCCPDFPLATNGKRQTGALLSDAKVINFIHLEYLCDKKYRDQLAHTHDIHHIILKEWSNKSKKWIITVIMTPGGSHHKDTSII